MTREFLSKKTRQFDGHAHDSVSSYDATITPKDLVDGMHNSNVGLFASVGHDVNPNYNELERLANNSGIGTMKCIEVPARVDFNGTQKNIHLLIVNPTGKAQEKLQNTVEKMWERRVTDALATMSLLKEKLPKLTFKGMDMEKVFDGRNISKYNISEMVYSIPKNKAYLHRQGVFDPAQLRARYLVGTAPLTRYVFPAEKFLKISKEFGAYVGLAHPAKEKRFRYSRNGNRNGNGNGNGNGRPASNVKYISNEMILKLSKMGLDFVEAYHPGHLPEDSERIRNVAADAGLPITIGSDIHHSGQVARLIFNPAEQNVVRKTMKKYAKKRNPFASELYERMREYGVVKKLD